MTMSIKIKSSTQKPMISELIGIENKSPEEAHKAIGVVLYDQYKTIDKLRNNNKKLWLEIQQYKTKGFNAENKNHSQIIMEKIWDNKEDDFWDTF